VGHAKDLNQIMIKHKEVAYMLIIYLQEAHAEEEWKFAVNRFQAKQQKQLEERIDTAKLLLEEGIFPKDSKVVVDTMDNLVGETFEAYPDRLYVIHEERVVYKGKEGPFGYVPKEVDVFLQSNFAKY
jgi:hypothetical protein